MGQNGTENSKEIPDDWVTKENEIKLKASLISNSCQKNPQKNFKNPAIAFNN